MKRAVQKVFGFSDAQLWGTQAEKEEIDSRYGFSPRWLLQRLGTEGLRDEFGEDIHLQALLHGLRKEEQARALQGAATPCLYVVDDVRFPNDARFIAQGGPGFVGAVLKIVATDVPAPSHAGHASELSIDDVSDTDIAATVVSSRALGVPHLVAEIDRVLLNSPLLTAVRPALPPRG
ncbi:MAG: hypothetical protein H7X95_04910 [Deltaproteobacteria bacterium]|nr:hypothetical protein [Deltaproteobacteria bacterium]